MRRCSPWAPVVDRLSRVAPGRGGCLVAAKVHKALSFGAAGAELTPVCAGASADVRWVCGWIP